MKIAFVHSGKAYLPEIKAYVRYFNAQEGYEAEELFADDKESIKSYNVIWRFQGVDLQGTSKDQILIHEYNSLSVGRFHSQKDLLKKLLNVKPQGRIFLNQAVKDKYNFRDKVPYLLRDMGIAEEFFLKQEQKDYDFVYIGTMAASRSIAVFLDHLIKHFPKYKVLLIGEPSAELYQQYSKFSNITFTGRLPYAEMPQVASKATYGLNLVPDVFPYNIQTSTKLLEYCALGLKVISTDYTWAREFQNQVQGKFFFVNKDRSNFKPEQLERFDFQTPDVRAYTWQNILQRAGLLAFLESLKR
ncbi:glycosyltransferase [Pontibacter ruber]|uniref:Glycosyltransferase n=1 Tax=Pontibacter ruber TaxID=1343895 RepID=A0ABW5D3X2_9BACT|nr:glycosyltransferase [Pontibacter ruber]